MLPPDPRPPLPPERSRRPAFAIAMNDMSAIARPRHGMGFYPFVGLTAALMATNALAIDDDHAVPERRAAVTVDQRATNQCLDGSILRGLTPRDL